MALLIPVGILETEEVFSDIKEAAKELGYSYLSLKNHFKKKHPMPLAISQYLTIVRIYEWPKYCIGCNTELTEKNASLYFSKYGVRKCKNCVNKYGRDLRKILKEKEPWRRGLLGAKNIKLLLKKQQNKCILCDTFLKLDSFHIDHIVPKSKGGKSIFENFQLLCSYCNYGKNTGSNEEYIKHCKKVVEANEEINNVRRKNTFSEIS